MANDNPADVFASANSDDLKKFSDILLNKYKGKLLELYIGDQFETINYEDYSSPQNCVIYGKLVDVLDRFVVLECYYVKDKQVVKTSDVLINAFQIRVMTELNEHGTLDDIFLSARSSDKVRKSIIAAFNK